MIQDNKQTVAEFLTDHIDNHHKTQREIAIELGYRNANIITMFKQGLTRLPLDKIGPIANALEINAVELFYLVMREYMPATFESLKPIMHGLELSEHEVQFIKSIRVLKWVKAV